MPELTPHLTRLYGPGTYGNKQYSKPVAVNECLSRNLIQISGWPDSFQKVCANLSKQLCFEVPANMAMASSENDISAFRVAPERIWLVFPRKNGIIEEIHNCLHGLQCSVIDISHSRTIIRISGQNAKEVICRALPVDIDESEFPVGSIIQSVMHRIPVLVHHVGDRTKDTYEIYLTNDFAIYFCELLVNTTKQFSCRILDAD